MLWVAAGLVGLARAREGAGGGASVRGHFVPGATGGGVFDGSADADACAGRGTERANAGGQAGGVTS
jgi:hypothetical protein